MMNRHARRAAAARARRVRKCHTAYYHSYVKHLPQEPLDAPVDQGLVYHLSFHHAPQCPFYHTEDLADCNCNPSITRHVEPRRS